MQRPAFLLLRAFVSVTCAWALICMDDDDEASFREALGHKIKTIDAAAARAGHWT